MVVVVESAMSGWHRLDESSWLLLVRVALGAIEKEADWIMVVGWIEWCFLFCFLFHFFTTCDYPPHLPVDGLRTARLMIILCHDPPRRTIIEMRTQPLLTKTNTMLRCPYGLSKLPTVLTVDQGISEYVRSPHDDASVHTTGFRWFLLVRIY
jgi:hypothetical protein